MYGHTRSVMYSPIVGIVHSPLGENYQVDDSETSIVCKAVAGGIRTRSYTTVAYQSCQLWHYDVIVAQLVATCLNKSVLANPKGKCDVRQHDTQTPRPSTPPHTHSVMYGPIVGIKHSPPGGNCELDGSKSRACARLLQAGFESGPIHQLQLSAASYDTTML